jgi:hypothetical protein
MVDKKNIYIKNFLRKKFDSNFFLIFYHFNFSKKEWIDLKTYCLENSIQLKTIKNNIGKQALNTSQYRNVHPLLTGSVLFIYGDVINYNKTLLFILNHPKFVLILGKYFVNLYVSKKITKFLMEFDNNKNVPFLYLFKKKISVDIFQNIYYNLFNLNNIYKYIK